MLHMYLRPAIRSEVPKVGFKVQIWLIREVAQFYSIGLFNWFAGASGGRGRNDARANPDRVIFSATWRLPFSINFLSLLLLLFPTSIYNLHYALFDSIDRRQSKHTHGYRFCNCCYFYS